MRSDQLSSAGMRWGNYVAAAFVLSVPMPALAQSADASPRYYSLAWVRGTGAEDCPPAAELQREVERRIGRPVFDASASYSIESSVQRDDRSSLPTRRSEIHVRNSDGVAIGERTLESSEADCRPLFSSTALAIALLVDPEAMALRDTRWGRVEPVGATNVPPASIVATNGQPLTAQFAAAEGQNPGAYARTSSVEVASNQPKKSLIASVAPVASSPVRAAANSERFAQLSASGIVGLALLPATEFGVSIGMRAWETPTIGFGLSAMYLPEVQGEPRAPVSVAVGLIALQPALMLELLSSEYLRLVGEFGPSLGAMQIAVHGASALGPRERWFAAMRSEIAVQFNLSTKAHLELATAGLVPLVRNRLVSLGPPEIQLFRQPLIGAVGRIGIGIQFP